METTESPTEAPTDERKLHISIILYLLDITLTYHLTYYPLNKHNNIIHSDPSTYGNHRESHRGTDR